MFPGSICGKFLTALSQFATLRDRIRDKVKYLGTFKVSVLEEVDLFYPNSCLFII
jgi:hypothetical protein